jgi:muramoyltetrapeptide carboxypeptidase
MIHPPALEPGDPIRVVSPAGPVTPTLLEPGLSVLRDWGLEVRVDEAVYDRSDTPGYLAGDDQRRLRAVQSALDEPDTRAIVFSRGGYGTMRLLAGLDFDSFRDHPKLLVGFSDLTALHLHAAARHRLATLHGPVVKSLRLHTPGDRSMRALRDALFGRRADGFEIDGLHTVTSGRTRGPLLGGNLTVLIHMLASDHAPPLDGSILVLEDIGEEDYRLDRMMTALRLSTDSADPAGIVLGGFIDCDGTYIDPDAVSEFVDELAAEFDCPVASGAPVGHGSENVAWPVGVEAELDAERGTLTVESDAVQAPARATTS